MFHYLLDADLPLFRSTGGKFEAAYTLWGNWPPGDQRRAPSAIELTDVKRVSLKNLQAIAGRRPWFMAVVFAAFACGL